MNSFPVVPLVGLLREELAGYGGLLSLFNQQQDQIWRREIETVAETSLAIEALAAETDAHRKAREAWISRFAESHGRPADAPLRQLLAFFPADQQPMLAAFIDEINELIERVRHRARQNQKILARAVEVHRDALALLNPQSRPRTYAPSGQASSIASPAATLHAAG